MADLCPGSGADDPLVRGLLGLVDCNVEGLVRGGYATLFESSSGFSLLLTSLMTIYVAVLGYQLLLGRTQLRIGNLALMAVKIGVIVALTTGWSSYQTVVYDFMFRGPVQLADAMLVGVQPRGSLFRGDVFDGLQSVFDALNAFSAAFAQNVAATASSPAGLGGSGFAAHALTASAVTLLLSSLGILLAAKVVLGLLLALGPIFIALLLFAATRGLFEGWLRATVAFAFAVLTATLVLGVALTVLEPSLLRLRENLAQNDYSLGPVYSVLVLVIVFAAVSVGAVLAGGVIALGLRLPRFPEARASEAAGATHLSASAVSGGASRAGRVVAATAALERRELAIFAQPAGSDDRRASMTITQRGRGGERGVAGPINETRLGEAPRRAAAPRALRGDARSTR